MSFYHVACAFNSVHGFHEDEFSAAGQNYFQTLLGYHFSVRPEVAAESFATPAILSEDVLAGIAAAIGGQDAFDLLLAAAVSDAAPELLEVQVVEEEVVAEVAPVEEAPVEEAPVEETPAEAPIMDEPVVETPVDGATE